MGPGTQAEPAGLNHIKHGCAKRCHNYHACASCTEAIPCIKAYDVIKTTRPIICRNYVMARETLEQSGLIIGALQKSFKKVFTVN